MAQFTRRDALSTLAGTVVAVAARGLSMTVVGALLCWLMFGWPSS